MGRSWHRFIRIVTPSFLFALVLATRAHAAWDPSGELIPVADATASPSACPDASGGAFTFWSEYASNGQPPTTVTVFGHRRSSDGTDAPGWPAAGKPLATFTFDHAAYFRSTQTAGDGAGGAFVLAYDPSASLSVHLRRLFHFRSDGSLAAGWPDAGVAMGDSTHGSVPQLLADGTGGAYIGWTDFVDAVLTSSLHFQGLFEARATRVLASGAFAPGWPSAGLLIEGVAPDSLRSFFARSLWLAADPAGGLFAANADSSDGDRNANVWHYSSSGVLAAGWPAAGVPLHTAAGSGLTALASDGTGGAYVAYTDSTVYPDGGAPRLLRLDGDGRRHAGWPAGGLVPMTSDKPLRYTGGAIADGAGGVYLLCGALDLDNHACAQIVRRDGDGAMHAGWPAEGIVVPDSIAPGIDLPPVADGAGGIYAVWKSGRDYSGSQPELVSLRLKADGTAATGWSIAAPRRVTTPANTTLTDVQGDGHGSCYGLVRDFSFTYQSWLHQVAPDDSGAASVPPVTLPNTLALTASPNPAPGALELSFTLPRAANTTVAIYAANGRRVRRWSGPMSAGAHRVPWDGRSDAGDRSAPGLYFAIVRAGGLEAARRFAVLE